jgi:hypothetical protein
MLLDLVDFVGPALLIGVWQLKGILLGSTSHYLVHRASVAVVVARRTSRRELAASASRRRGSIAWRAGWIRMCSICATRCRRMTTAVMRIDCEKRQASSVEKEDKEEPEVGAEAELEAHPRAPRCAVSMRRHT